MRESITVSADLNSQTAQHYQQVIGELLERVAQLEAVALRGSDGFYCHTFENVAVGMAQINMYGCFMRANRCMAALLGYAPEDFPGRNALDFIHPDDHAECVAEMKRLRCGDIVQFKRQKRFLHRDGHIVWVQVTTALHRDERGDPLWFLPVVEDISAIKEAEELRFSLEEALDRRKREARTLIRNAPDMILRIDNAHRILLANPAAEQLMGLPEGSLIGKTLMDFHLSKTITEHLLGAIDLVQATAQPFLLEEEMHPSAGGKQLHLSFSPEMSATGEVESVLVVGRDITPLKRLEEDLRRAKETAENASRAKSEFLANMSHEIRTPMTVIMAALEQLQDTEPLPRQVQFLEMATNSAERLLTVIDDILDISKIEARHLEIHLNAFDLREWLEDTVSLFLYQADKKGLQLSWNLAEDLPEQIIGDIDRLGQILVNLLGNAIKFTETGVVAVTASRRQSQLAIAVTDTGIGIPGDKHGELFTSFSQLDSSRTRRFGGTGLGLAISKGLAKLMGGEIEVDSKEGQGSIFTLTIPLRSADAETANQSEIEPTPLPDRPSTILLVEDEPMVRQMVELVLRQHGWQVVCASDGLAAVELWQRQRIDLVLMDVQMPGVDGFTATRMIRQKEEGGCKHTPILAITAHARREDRDQCLAAGMDGFLTKPLNLRQLFTTVEEHLGGRQ